MLNEQSHIKVSVCVVTYNQESFIFKCLQSLIEQSTDFDFEIIVGDDCSTDRTRDIVRAFSTKYPSLIVENFHNVNLGTVKNIASTYKLARGKYICHMDGDDYALPGKLKEQFDILEANEQCIICSHDMHVVDSHGSLLRNSFFMKREGQYNIFTLYRDLPFFCHSSKMFRNKFDSLYWSQLADNTLDIEVHVFQAKEGDIYHLNKPLGGYRMFTGVSSSMRGVNPALVEGALRIFDSAVNDYPQHKTELDKYRATAFFKFAYQAAISNDLRALQKYIFISIQSSKISFFQVFFYRLSIFPSAVVFLCKMRAKLRGYNI